MCENSSKAIDELFSNETSNVEIIRISNVLDNKSEIIELYVQRPKYNYFEVNEYGVPLYLIENIEKQKKKMVQYRKMFNQ